MPGGRPTNIDAAPDPVTSSTNTWSVRAASEYPQIVDPGRSENGNVSEKDDGPSGGNVAVPPTPKPVPAKKTLSYGVPLTVPEPLPMSPPQNSAIWWVPARQGEQMSAPPSLKRPVSENVSPSM